MAWYDVTGTVADWVMVGAAVYAATQAHKWVQDKTNNDLYQLSKEVIVNNHESIYKAFESSARAARYYTPSLSRAKYNPNFIELLPSIEFIQDELNNINEMYKNKSNLESNMRMLNKLGFAYEKKASSLIVDKLQDLYFKDLIFPLKAFWQMLYAHAASLEEIVSEQRSSDGVYNQLEDFNDMIQEHFSKIKILYNDFDKLHDSPLKYFCKK